MEIEGFSGSFYIDSAVNFSIFMIFEALKSISKAFEVKFSVEYVD